MNESLFPTVYLRPGEADRIAQGHPWVFDSSILKLTRPADDGAVVQVKDHRHRYLGVGFYNSKSKIQVRLLAQERVTPDAAFFEKRIRAALALRQRHMPQASSFRVVNAESDFLSGLIVDKYEDVLAVNTSSLGMDQRKPMLIEALQAVFQPRAIVERNDTASRKMEGLPERVGLLAGQVPGEMTIKLNGLSFALDPLGGHKTGLYLDQQTNYRAVEELVKLTRPDQTLDAFSFMGGFGLHAARGGAARVHMLDQSAEALTMAGRMADLNGLASRCTTECANIFDWLKAQTVTRPNEKLIPRFDFVILDPPSFTRSRAAVPEALRGYKEIHLRALRLLRPGGVLATFCCSHHVPATMFEDIILAAAVDSRRVLRRIATLSQSPDHPVIPIIPETEYLKGFAFEIAR